MISLLESELEKIKLKRSVRSLESMREIFGFGSCTESEEQQRKRDREKQRPRPPKDALYSKTLGNIASDSGETHMLLQESG